jgi:hypothetical protein
MCCRFTLACGCGFEVGEELFVPKSLDRVRHDPVVASQFVHPTMPCGGFERTPIALPAGSRFAINWVILKPNKRQNLRR